ncbi:RDD family protein [Streptomyces naganishii JCM 4654]|uniref:RDD family protein n=2 Tax=Streptomyces naganishii TaxID=285447 RepID=A0A919CT15_9ACTN|nr:RDD family protein [Streptomyces naganishii JCM 4654]
MGSWLSGPRAAIEDAGADLGYRGEQLGLPEEGPGSIARPGRRLGALAVDWGLCLLIAYSLIADSYHSAAQVWAPLVLFALMVLTLGTVGFTPGKRLFGLRVVALDTGRVQPLRALLRTVLFFLAIPPLVWDRDGRGLHDRLAGTVEIRS